MWLAALGLYAWVSLLLGAHGACMWLTDLSCGLQACHNLVLWCFAACKHTLKQRKPAMSYINNLLWSLNIS